MRVLLVGHGAPGGIGRYEVLLHTALGELARAGRLERQSLFLAAFPPYVREGLDGGEAWSAGGSRARLLGSVARALVRWRPDLAVFTHVNLAPLGQLGGIIRPGLRYAVAVYGVDVWRRLPLLRRAALRGAWRVVSISQYTTDQIETRHGVRRARVVLVPPSLPASAVFGPSAGPATTGQEAGGEGPLLLSVTRLEATERYKGVDTVIEALPAVLRACPSARYTVVGEGADIARLRGIAERLGVGSHVHFAGRVSSAALAELYARCALFLLPSGGEGFGIVFLEAMAHARAVVGGAHGGTPDVVEHGRTGLLVEHGDVGQAAAAITALLGDPARREAMGRAGYERLVSEFTFDRFVQRLADALAN